MDRLPQRVEIFIEPNGEVVISDLLDGLVPVVRALDGSAPSVAAKETATSDLPKSEPTP